MWILFTLFIQVLVTPPGEALAQAQLEAEAIPLCQFAAINICQTSSSGGHAGSIFTTVDGHCAKRFTHKHESEKLFYESFKRDYSNSNLAEFIPKFYGICKTDRDEYYLKMENLKQGFKRPWEMDTKIGAYTASRRELLAAGHSYLHILSKLGLHYYLDNLSTSSRNCALRVSNISQELDVEPLGKRTMRRDPQKALINYFPGISSEISNGGKGKKIIECFTKKLEKLTSVIADPSFEQFHLVGASLLFVYDRDQLVSSSASDEVEAEPDLCSLHLIDFAHSHIGVLPSVEKKAERTNDLKYVESFRLGIKNLHKMIQSLHP